MTLRLLPLVASLMLANEQGVAAATFDRAAWQSDYARLKVALAQDYANLDWQVERRGMNLARADEMISAMLEHADNDTAATLAIVKLVEAFRDPHLQLSAGPAPAGATLVPRSSEVRGPATLPSSCEQTGYADGRPSTQLPYPAAPGWTEVSATPFQAGLIGDIGIIRIPAFGEDRYLAACKAVERRGLEGRELQLATRAELNRQLATLVDTLKSKGMKRLAIDLSRNGGGSEWSSEAVTYFAEGKLHRIEPRQVGASCDRTSIWKGQKPVCAAYVAPPTTQWLEGKPIWTGALAILADRRTASAAEEFIAWLRDNDKAVMGGERTFGAGCGYIDGGATFQFTAVPMHLMIPNCSRFTSDGTNEIEGQAPDLAIDWQQLKPDEVPAKLKALFSLGSN